MRVNTKMWGLVVLLMMVVTMSCLGADGMTLKIKIQSASAEQVVLLRNKLKGGYVGYDTVAIIPVRRGEAIFKKEIPMPMYVTAVWKGGKYVCNFVLEPGEIEVADLGDDYTVQGGVLNGMAIRAVNEHPDYALINKEYSQYMRIASDTTLSAAVRQGNIKNIQASRSKLWRAKNRILLEIYNAQTSPINKLALLSSWNFLNSDKEKFYSEVEALAKVIPSDNSDMEIFMAMKRDMQYRDSVESMLSKGMSKNFTRKSLSGEVCDLHKMASEAELTLLEFWASWCVPCRAEIPHLKEAYHQYSGKGFQIYAVSLDAKESAWKEASAKEQFPWINTRDEEEGAEFSIMKEYNVKGIPANFLLDKEGRIVARDLRGNDLAKELEKRLGK